MPSPPENLPVVYPGDIDQQKPLRCLGICLRRTLMVSVCPAILAGFILLSMWIYLSPGVPGVSVENAYLTRFNLTTSKTPSGSTNYILDYDLKVEFGLRNGYHHQNCYRDVEVVTYYGGDSQRLSPAPLQDLCLSSKTSSNASMGFAGRTLLKLDPAQVGVFGDEQKAGFFRLTVTLKGEVTATMETTKWTYWTYVELRCLLAVPLVGNVTSPTKFSRVGCDDVTPLPPPKLTA